MWNREKTLVISSPNLGGLSKISDDGIEVIDAISTTGISSDNNLFVRSLQHEDHAVFELLYRDGSTKQFIYKDIWDIHDVFLVNDHFYAVSSGSNEVVLISVFNGDIVQRWTYPGENDSWHLNGLGQLERTDGRVSIRSFSNAPGIYRSFLPSWIHYGSSIIQHTLGTADRAAFTQICGLQLLYL